MVLNVLLNKLSDHMDGKGTTNEDCGIKEVWASNLDEEMKSIRELVWEFPYVAMDTEFPGVVARPIGEFKSTTDYQYQLLRCNVDLLRLIQVGITFMNDKGEMPEEFSTWQFNFKFSLGNDMFAQNSIDLLQDSGLNFSRHEEDGIDPHYFAELIMTSGLVLNEEVTWLSFHSGYDFGYLLKLLRCQPLPGDESEFFDILKTYFPKVYDVKYLMKSCRVLKGGLQEVAEQLEIERIGPQHQAGSDSLLTGQAFFRMKELFFEDNMDDKRYCGYLYGLGLSYSGNEAAHEEPSCDKFENVREGGGDSEDSSDEGDAKEPTPSTHHHDQQLFSVAHSLRTSATNSSAGSEPPQAECPSQAPDNEQSSFLSSSESSREDPTMPGEANYNATASSTNSSEKGD